MHIIHLNDSSFFITPAVFLKHFKNKKKKLEIIIMYTTMKVIHENEINIVIMTSQCKSTA